MKKKILVSACLLGRNCRYNGGNSNLSELEDAGVEWIPVCPEEAGELGTPRPAAEMQMDAASILSGNGHVQTIHGKDVTDKFIKGARLSLQAGQAEGVKTAILKSRSPSCGIENIYDGSFTGTLIKGSGIFAQLCSTSGVRCISSESVEEIKNTISKQK